MERVLRSFVSANKYVCKKLEKHLPQRRINIHLSYDQAVAAYASRLEGASVADVGAGRRSSFASCLDNRERLRIIGVDISNDELAQNHDVDERRVSDITQRLPFSSGELDLVASRAVLEHLGDIDAFVVDCARVLRAGGYSIHLFASKFAPFAILNQLLPDRVAHTLLDAFHPECTGQLGFKSYYDQTYASKIVRLFQRHGFEIIDIKVSYYQSGYYNFFLPLYLVSVVYELLIYAAGARDLAAKVMITTRKRPESA